MEKCLCGKLVANTIFPRIVAGRLITIQRNFTRCPSCLEKQKTAARLYRQTDRFRVLDKLRKDKRREKGFCSSCGRLLDLEHEEAPFMVKARNQKVCRGCLNSMADLKAIRAGY